jgi:RNA polymerase sigma factor (sigma-70 family)
MNELSDEYLMEKVKLGNIDYMSELFKRYNKQILNYFYKSTGKLEDSQDLTQMVFLRILEYRTSFDKSKCFKPWMYHVAKNVINRHYQFKKDNVLFVETPDNVSNSLSQYDLPDHSQDEKLYKSINKLSDEYKDLIILSKFQGLKYKEIAEIFSTTEASIKNKIFRALDKLRKVYFETE